MGLLDFERIYDYIIDRHELHSAYEDNLDHNLSKEMFNDQLQNQINSVKAYLRNNSSSEWTTYLNNLESVDIESLSYPIDNFQKWFNNQSGFSSKSILELP